MCNLTEVCHKKSVKGWKVVAIHKKNGRYYSVAMGFCYNDYRKIPVVKEQKRMSLFYSGVILRSLIYGGYRENMLGRTAIFLDKDSAMRNLSSLGKPIYPDFEMQVVKAKVSEDILLGTYGVSDVAAGRRLEFV